MRKEREAFIEHLVAEGVTPRRVQCISCVLLHVVRILDLHDGRQVTRADVANAMFTWADDTGGESRSVISYAAFRATATRFLRFHALLKEVKEPIPFSDHLDAYLRSKAESGLQPTTLSTQRSDLAYFLRWLGLRLPDISKTSARDIDDYFAHRRVGRSNNSVATESSGLRGLFEYLAHEGLCDPYLFTGITFGNRSLPSPATPPPWKQVRRMLDVRLGNGSDARMRAMLFFCSVYGFRTSEASNLKLRDFDWQKAAFTVVRSKNSRVQRFPIIEPLRLMLQDYLRTRPACDSDFLFVTFHPPYKRVKPGLISMAAERRFNILGIQPERGGAHALRHACASQLLRSGMGLPQLADFLGHKGVGTVSRYAKHDCASLAAVADFSLAAVL